MDFARFSEPAYLIGQIFGLIAVVLGFISFQMKDAKKLLLFQCGVSTAFCIHFWLIDAKTGFMLNLACILRNVAYYFKDKKILSTIAVPIFFSALMGVLGAFSWDGWYSIFFVVALVVNTFCMSFKKPDHIRASILFTSPLALTYDVFASSYGGVIYESFVIVSSAIGLIRFAKLRKAERILANAENNVGREQDQTETEGRK